MLTMSYYNNLSSFWRNKTIKCEVSKNFVQNTKIRFSLDNFLMSFAYLLISSFCFFLGGVFLCFFFVKNHFSSFFLFCFFFCFLRSPSLLYSIRLYICGSVFTLRSLFLLFFGGGVGSRGVLGFACFSILFCWL